MAQNMYTNMNNMPGQSMVGSPAYSTYAAASSQEDRGASVEGLSDAFGTMSVNNGTYTSAENGLEGNSTGHNGILRPSTNLKGNKQYPYPVGDTMYTSTGLSPTQADYSRYQLHLNWLAPHLTFPAGSFPAATAAGLSNQIPATRTQQWMPSQAIPPVPGLVEPRRTSWSSRDEPSPQTPPYGSKIGYNPYSGRSPSNFGSSHSSTPPTMSPQSTHFICKNQEGEAIYIDFWALINREPVVPEPVPAIHSGPDGGRGTLDKILDNRDGTTNVYVRGLQPDTSDGMLLGYGERFGPVISCKSIIDASSGHCKGFGFIKYHNFIDAENAIRGFYYRGYEAKFARKSHNSRLKDLARPDNANLYVSNLPRLYNEEMLKRLFQEKFPEQSHPHHQAGSCKILKDSCGMSRGVGFARFETSEICSEVIAVFNNKIIEDGKSSTMLQIRFADTEEQKQLKAITAVKRQFKADEYNEAVYGTPFGERNPSNGYLHSPLQGRVQGASATWMQSTPSSSASPSSLGNYPHSALRSRKPSNLSIGIMAVAENGPASTVPAEIRGASTTSKMTAMKTAVETSNPVGQSPSAVKATLTENVRPSATQSPTSVAVSPAKSKL